MQQYMWILRQFFISFVLLHNLYPLNTIIVNARVISKRDTQENVTTISSPPDIITEKNVVIENITTINPLITTLVTERIEKITTEFPVIENTPLPIARITVNDMKILITTTERNDISTTHAITENLTTSTKVESALADEKLEDSPTKKLTTPPVFNKDKENITENIFLIDVPTTKKYADKEEIVKKNEREESFEGISTEEMITDETTTSGLSKFDHKKRSFNPNDYTSEEPSKEFESEFKLTTIDADNQKSEKPEITAAPLIQSKTEINSSGKNEETTTFSDENSNVDEDNKDLTKATTTAATTTTGIATIATPEMITTFQTTTETITASSLNISSNSLNKNSTVLGNIKILKDKSTKYDVAINEIRNFTVISTINKTGGEKRPKQLKDSNMTLPDAPEVWALDGMKNGVKEINTLNNGGKLLNITVIDQDNALPEINTTGSTKLLADWTQIVKEVDINSNNNSEKISPNSIENILENENVKVKESPLSSLDPQKSNEKLQQHENQIISNVVNSIHKAKVNQSSSSRVIEIPTSSITSPTAQEAKTTPSIEKNQVEDADSEYINNKKIIRIKNVTRNGILKEDTVKFPLSSTIAPLPGKVLPTPTATTSSPFAKIIQSTTEIENTIVKITTLPQPVLTMAVTEGKETTTTESNFSNRKQTTLSPFVNLIDATTISISGQVTPFEQVIPSSSPTNTVVNISVRSTSERSITPTESNRNSNNGTTIGEEEVKISDILDKSTKKIDSIKTAQSYANFSNISTSSLPISEQSNIITSSSPITMIENVSSTTTDEPLSSSTAYTMPLQPDIEYQSSSSTTEELFNFSSTETTNLIDEFSSTDSLEMKISTSLIDSILEISTESTTTTVEGIDDDQSTSETSKMSTTTFISPPPGKYDTTLGLITSTEDISTTTIFQNIPTKYDPHFITESSTTPTGTTTTTTVKTTTMQSNIIPKIFDITTEETMFPPTLISTSTHYPHMDGSEENGQMEGGMMPHPPQRDDANNISNDTDYNVIIAISVSVVGIIALILLVGFLYVMRKRQKNLTYSQRCRPVSLDAYSLDNVSICNSVRRKGALRASKRSYGNVAFDDPSLKHNVLNIQDLSKFVEKKSTIYEEYKDVPQITARPDEVPQGCEDKNRYANVIPLPETRVILQQLNGDDKTEYINANYVRGPKDPPNYYIACQAPLESTVADFWRMIWEQNSRVIIQATDLVENGKEKCAEYLPPSITIDNHVVYGDFQITLKNREVKEKYAVSTLHIKNTIKNTWREITHFWYQWPETGVPSDEAAVIAMLLEARSCLKIATQEQADDQEDGKTTTTIATNGDLSTETNGNVDKTKSLKAQGPLTVHCSPGTGRTGTIISCDIALRSLETPKRSVDIPQIVYYVRRGRASAVQTKEQYEFIYRIAHMYATKISGPISET